MRMEMLFWQAHKKSIILFYFIKKDVWKSSQALNHIILPEGEKCNDEKFLNTYTFIGLEKSSDV